MTDCTTTYDALVELNSFPEVAPPPLLGTFWVLGKSYDLPQQKSEYLKDVKSRIWCTYRKGFRAISGTSLTSDNGWGCTLRCGQMLMAQALICQHLGRGWRWPVDHHDPSYSIYMEILHKFLDSRDSEYSLQMIALQGADFGRPVGHWFGPNNVAQALKKLSVHDVLSQMAVHVAMDMLVVIEDLKKLCREPHEIPGHVKVTNEQGEPISSLRCRRSISDVSEMQGQMSSERAATFQNQATPSRPLFKTPPMGAQKQATKFKTQPSTALSDKQGTGQAVGRVPTITRNSSIKKALTSYMRSSSDADGGVSFTESLEFLKLSITSNSASSVDSQSEFETLKEPSEVHHSDPPMSREEENLTAGAGVSEDGGLGPLSNFRPLLLFIPLRLGQDSFNMEYAVALKNCLKIPQSVGFIGGRPRHAFYFIGYHKDQLLYLDPHTVQPTVNVTDPCHIPDQTYHCSSPDRIPINDLDPSIALGFFCKDEEDLDDLIRRLKSEVLSHGIRYKMFEMTEERPSYWGPFDNHMDLFSPGEPFMLVDRPVEEVDDDLDEGFEIISWPTTPVTHITPRLNK